MRATRRYWSAVALAATLAALAVLTDRPVLLVGAAGLAGLLVSAQVAFLRALVRADEAISVEQTPDRDRAVADAEIDVTLSVTLDGPAPIDLAVEAGLPVAATGTERTDRVATVHRGGRSARTVFPTTLPVAGRHDFRRATLRAEDPLGLVTESVPVGPAPTVAVAPRGPREIHVGAGGERVAAAFGEHPAGRLGPGLAPTELREYVPGDAARRIDWKATARLAHPHVREQEAETDRPTVLVVDHRASTGVGPPGETKLDYLRAVALTFVGSARSFDDPLGLYAVGEEGLTVASSPGTAPGDYGAVERALVDLEATGPADATPAPRSIRAPASAREVASALADDGPFARTLRPYLADAAAYVHRVEEDPLFRSVRTTRRRIGGAHWTVILTDDAERPELLEAVRAARRGEDRVVVFLAPTVLYEPGGLADLDVAYDRYGDFEAFRRRLDGMGGVSAFEVAPGDRLEAVLGDHHHAAGREARR